MGSGDEMAGRIRSVKPEFLEDADLCVQSAETRLLFVCLWVLSDDYGNLQDCEEWIKAQAFWGDPKVTPEKVREMLATLSRLGMLTPYEVRGKRYLHVTNWDRHQRVDKPGKPRVPGPENAVFVEETSDSKNVRETPENIRGDLATERNREQGTGNREGSSPAPEDPVVPVFDHWRSEHGHEKAKLTKERRTRIQARLREGYSADDLCAAISAAKLDPFLMGQNDRSTVYDDLVSLLKDGSKVERLLALRGKPVPSVQTGSSLKDRATVAWSRVMEATRRVGAHQLPKFADPLTAALVKRWGWRTLCLGDEVSNRIRFIAAYQELARENP